ncbi:MAG: hypothetical protein WCN98_03165 [Verrucomicrobiaceae bacterium]
MQLERRTLLLAILTVLAFSIAGLIHAGPPFVTDDPEPVELHHWEFYLATQQYHNSDGWSGTAPHLELNYGAAPDLQLHLIAPFPYDKPMDVTSHHGYGDTELGFKYRFVHTGEEGSEFQVGIFPLVELPTGNSDKGLGNGKTQVFVPLWIQKEFGKWTTYGGGGYWFNPGEGNRDYWYAGWEVQRKLTESLTAGIEVQFRTADTVDARNSFALNAGGIWDLSEKYHILFSAGHTVSGRREFQGYLALQITLGPEDKMAGVK